MVLVFLCGRQEPGLGESSSRWLSVSTQQGQLLQGRTHWALPNRDSKLWTQSRSFILALEIHGARFCKEMD